MRSLPVSSLPVSVSLALLAFLSLFASHPASGQVVLLSDRSNALTIAIRQGCQDYTWPNVTFPSAPPKTEWRLAAVRRICTTLGVNGATLEIRADGLVMKVDGQKQNTEKFLPTLYAGAQYPSSVSRIVVLGSGEMTFTPPSSKAKLVSLTDEFKKIVRQVQFIQNQYGLSKTAAVIDLKIAGDESLTFGGLADQSTEAAALRAEFLGRCLAKAWDLPYERSVLCGLQAALLRLTP